LIVNGMDAMNTVEESKRVLIICGHRETRDGKSEALLSVQDAGTGFKPQEMDRLFEAFIQRSRKGWEWVGNQPLDRRSSRWTVVGRIK